jgi:hypothetical protein
MTYIMANSHFYSLILRLVEFRVVRVRLGIEGLCPLSATERFTERLAVEFKFRFMLRVFTPMLRFYLPSSCSMRCFILFYCCWFSDLRISSSLRLSRGG